MMVGLVGIIFLSLMSDRSYGINNCKYFGGETGPLIPIDVCTKWNSIENTGSYLYKCDEFNQIYLHYFANNDNCQGSQEEISANPIWPFVQNCGGGICNHVIIREYSFTEIRENMCYKNESRNDFIEYSFVTSCWDSTFVPHTSWYHIYSIHNFIHIFITFCYIFVFVYRSMDCTEDSFSFKFYDEDSCNGEAKNVTKITEGCRIESDIINRLENITFYNHSGFGSNFSRNSNNTYWEIKACGDATYPWLWILITCLTGVCCIGCCCCCLFKYFYRKNCNNKKCRAGKQKNIDPLIVNETKEGDYTTKA